MPAYYYQLDSGKFRPLGAFDTDAECIACHDQAFGMDDNLDEPGDSPTPWPGDFPLDYHRWHDLNIRAYFIEDPLRLYTRVDFWRGITGFGRKQMVEMGFISSPVRGYTLRGADRWFCHGNQRAILYYLQYGEYDLPLPY